MKDIMNHKKAIVLTGLIGVLVCLTGAICLITNPKSVKAARTSVTPEKAVLLLKDDILSEDEEISAEEEKEQKIREKEEAAIRDAIMEHNKSSFPHDFACCSFVSLERKYSVPVSKFTFYGWALYSKYKFLENGMEEVESSHLPVALTFTVNEDEEYTLEEYWEPRDGSYFVTDVREKFPAHIAEDGLDSQKYVKRQKQECYARAVVCNGLDTDTIAEQLLQAICAGSLSESSEPQEYINAHYSEYQELIYYGDYTVRYFLKRFEKKEENGLEGHVMARACEEILELRGKLPVNADTAATGQEWYEALKTYEKDIVESKRSKIE